MDTRERKRPGGVSLAVVALMAPQHGSEARHVHGFGPLVHLVCGEMDQQGGLGESLHPLHQGGRDVELPRALGVLLA